MCPVVVDDKVYEHHAYVASSNYLMAVSVISIFTVASLRRLSNNTLIDGVGGNEIESRSGRKCKMSSRRLDKQHVLACIGGRLAIQEQRRVVTVPLAVCLAAVQVAIGNTSPRR